MRGAALRWRAPPPALQQCLGRSGQTATASAEARPARRLGANVHGAWSGRPERSRLICNITNDNAEIFKEGENDPGNDPHTLMGPAYDAHPDTPNPEMGDLATRVGFDWYDLAVEGFTFKEDSDYWFNAPPGGCREVEQRPMHVRHPDPFTTVVAVSAEHFGAGRPKLSELREGQVITGEITEHLAIHGIKVDFGAEYDGLLPVKDKFAFRDMRLAYNMKHADGPLDLGAEVTARIHKIRDPKIFRWPVQLVIESPMIHQLDPEVFDPDSWRCPKDLRGVNTDEQLRLRFTEEELRAATAKYKQTPPFDVWADLAQPFINEDEVYYYQEERTDEEGLPYGHWLPVPVGKDGKQMIDDFLKEGEAPVNIATYEDIVGHPGLENVDVMQVGDELVVLDDDALLQERVAPPDEVYSSWH